MTQQILLSPCKIAYLRATTAELRLLSNLSTAQLSCQILKMARSLGKFMVPPVIPNSIVSLTFLNSSLFMNLYFNHCQAASCDLDRLD